MDERKLRPKNRQDEAGMSPTQEVAEEPFFWSMTCENLWNMYPPKTNMTMENPPFEDVFPIENGGFSNVMLVFQGVSPFN